MAVLGLSKISKKLNATRSPDPEAIYRRDAVHFPFEVPPSISLSLSLAQYVDREKDIDRWKHRLFLFVSVNEKGVEKCLTISQPFQFWFYSYPNCSFPLLIYRKMNNNESHFLESKWRERVEKYL